MKLQLLIFCTILLIGCKKERLSLGSSPIVNFELNYRDKGTVSYDNPECEFDNTDNQTQFTFISTTSPNELDAFVLFSRYRNKNELDSVIDKIAIELHIELLEGKASFTPEYLEGLLESEDSNENAKHIYPHIQVEICGERYNNENEINEPGESVFKLNDNFKYKINEFEVLYQSECIDRELLYLDITVEGMLYQHTWGKQDSTYLNESNLKLLFDLQN